MKTEYDEVKEILIRHMGPQALDANLDDLVDMGTELYDELLNYYMESGEMPYGVAKARTGMPDEWIAERLYDLGLVKEMA